MKTLFNIGQENAVGSEHLLLLEIGRDYCSTAFLHKENNTIDRITYSSLDEFQMQGQLLVLIDSVKDSDPQSVIVCSAYPEALLFPSRFFSADHSLLDLVYEQPSQVYFHDTIGEWQIINAYSLPTAVCEALERSFASVQYIHAYTPAIKVYNGFVANNQLSVHFTEQSFRVLLKKDMAIHLVQTYLYKTPLDVLYYLLKICYEFHLKQEDVVLILSGLVEKDSNLFAELQQYFSTVHFAQQPEIKLPQSPHPHHFFTSIYNLAACVS